MYLLCLIGHAVHAYESKHQKEQYCFPYCCGYFPEKGVTSGFEFSLLFPLEELEVGHVQAVQVRAVLVAYLHVPSLLSFKKKLAFETSPLAP